MSEFLDVGSGRPGPSRRARLLVLAVLVGVVAAGVVVDRRLRTAEERRVAACRDDVAAAVDLAGRRVRAAYEYVRPSLMEPTPELQASVRRLVSDAAVGAEAPLAEPRTACDGITILPLHDDLRSRRDRCLAVLDAQRAGLSSVARDGSALGDWLGVPRTC